MALPEFNEHGDLPAGVYRATLEECCARFGKVNDRRQAVTARFLQICNLARATSKLEVTLCR